MRIIRLAAAYLPLSLAIATPVTAQAQSSANARLCGTVRADESGAGLAEARVRVFRYEGQQQRTWEAVTAADGSFCVTGLTPTFHRVSIRKPGYMRLENQPVTLSPGETREMNVRLGVYVPQRIAPPDEVDY